MVHNQKLILVFTARLEDELKEFFLSEKQTLGVKSHSEALRIMLTNYKRLSTMEIDFERIKTLLQIIIETYEVDTGNKLNAKNLLEKVVTKKELGETLSKYFS